MIRLPVSIGEAIDKLTILDIKCKRIKDPERNLYCKQEYDILRAELQPYLEQCAFYYKQLYDINDTIWVMQDEVRAAPDPLKCVAIMDKNDMRFRIKDVVNHVTNSYLREKKGYDKRRALFIAHLGLGDHIGMIGAIRYIAMQHDETFVVCKSSNLANLQSFFSDNPTIKFIDVGSGFYLPGHWPNNDTPGKVIMYDRNDWTNVYESGFYMKGWHEMVDLPICFYKDLGLDPAIRYTHFYVPTPKESIELYNNIRGMSYIFVQQKASDCFTNLVTWDKDEILTIDPNVNVYEPGHKWYELASLFINRPFPYYYETITHAKEIHTVDSSFYCIACRLPVEASVKRCYARGTGAFIPSYEFN